MKILFIIYFLSFVNSKTIITSYTNYEIYNDNKLLLISDQLTEYYFITGAIEKISFIIELPPFGRERNTTCLTIKSNDNQDNFSHKSYYEHSDILYDKTVMKIVESLMLYFDVRRIVLFSIERKDNNSITNIYASIY